jgi:hypothetical protein
MPRKPDKDKYKPLALPAIVAIPAAEDQTLVLSQEIFDSLELESDEHADFLLALNILTFQVKERCSLAAAAEHFGLKRWTLHRERWRVLLSKANRLIVSDASMDARAATKLALDNWVAVVNSMIDVALHGEKGNDRVAAAEFLKVHVIDKVEQRNDEDSPEAVYLKSQGHNFNPMSVLVRIEPGQSATITPVSNDIVEGEIVTGDEA